MIRIKDITGALCRITAGRIPGEEVARRAGAHPFILEKSSGMAGKAVLETPGLVCGNPEGRGERLGIGMTLTESVIELAGAMGLDAVLVHHPVADAASSGGVPLKPYLELYGLALFELHEAFHGLHPGIAFLHGHRVVWAEHAFEGIPGNILLRGEALPEIRTAGDILARLNGFMGAAVEKEVTEAERRIRACPNICETSLAAVPLLLNGRPDARVNHILHFFPHTGFTTGHMKAALKAYPDTDTLIVSISRVQKDSSITRLAKDIGITLIAGNSHALEIFENGLPLAFALQHELPGISISILRERVTAVPLNSFGNSQIRDYGLKMAGCITGDKLENKE